MKNMAWGAVLALAFAANGCTRIGEARMPVAAKVNAAYPVAPEVTLAAERLLSLLADDAKAVEAVKAQVESRMALRALTCAKDVQIGRFDSVATVRSLSMAVPCFQAQDAELQKYYGIRTVGVLLARPPLRPLKAAGAMATLPRGVLTRIGAGAVARDAGVAVLSDGVHNVVVELPGAKPIAELPRLSDFADTFMRVSPNGRVVMLNATGQGPTFVDAESGHRLWSAGSMGTRLLAWLPEVAAFVMADRNGDALLADGETGRMEPHPMALKNTSYAAALPGGAARLLMGTARELMLVEHLRTSQGIDATGVKQYTITSGPGITSGHPVPMRSGRMVVYASMRDVGWLDLERSTSGTWRTAPLFGGAFAKLDESHLMIDGQDATRMALQPWTFDIEHETVAPIDLGGPHGLIVDIGDRVGYLRRSDDAWFGDTVKAGEAQPLDKVVGAFELQQQLAKLQEQAGQGADAGAAAGPGGGAGAAGGSATPAPVPMPGLADVPADAMVHIVGIYEGERIAGPVSGHPKRNVRVVARVSARPIVLVLASYEPVNWSVANVGARIAAVLLSGYHPSTVNGVGDAPVLRIGSSFAYAAGSPEYQKLRQSVMQYTGNRQILSFQGSYTGSDFSVGGR